ncbi:MAG: bifunctional adenosylcobinamide kinase/adenosylcobinamide-phosphate guanylyltransferase [Corynebacterium sp.]|nr:bifunctional adenosylcobinamide kinase/adenosylcobinamide-phosphate guanylyltransferase [Corynebacterium sp.]
MHTLVLGGARSGKSNFAESLCPASTTYVATARPSHGEFDTDFQARIAKHVARRPRSWTTEDSQDLLEVLASDTAEFLLVDDLGTWLSAHIDAADAWQEPHELAAELTEQLVIQLQRNLHRTVVLVTPEVGMGIIPEHPSGRYFRDCIGLLNTAVANSCQRVVLVIAGQPLELKSP